jgi:hypothetical protein
MTTWSEGQERRRRRAAAEIATHQKVAPTEGDAPLNDLRRDLGHTEMSLIITSKVVGPASWSDASIEALKALLSAQADRTRESDTPGQPPARVLP